MKTSGDSAGQQSRISFRSNQGVNVSVNPVRVLRHVVQFELYRSNGELRVSEVLHDFNIVLGGRISYSGRATVKNLIKTGIAEIAEATLEDSWTVSDLGSDSILACSNSFRVEYDRLIRNWEKFCRVSSDYKMLVADIQMYLTGLRLWVDKLGLDISVGLTSGNADREFEMLRELSPGVISSMNTLFAKYEYLIGEVEDIDRPIHRAYLQRQIHPLVLCSPFANRTFTKPLGYAGDYEMVNMLLRDPFEGETPYARLVNSWFIAQPPAEAHRNRIHLLTQKLAEETIRVTSLGRSARVFSLGSGPAAELQEFLIRYPISDRASMVLLDFNDETLTYANRLLNEIKLRHGRIMPLQFVKKSVLHILKAAGKGGTSGPDQHYDYVYCAGLFDYLPDHVCKQLVTILYDMLAPGGLLLVTNVDTYNPICHMLENLLEWHLLYRNAAQFRNLCPNDISTDDVRICADYTGVNIFMEIRKAAS